MATVNLGRIKPVFRGAFSNSTAYVIDDIVTSGNETFIAIAATQGNATTDASKWTKLAAKGADGTDVAATLANKEIAFKTNAGALDGIPIGSAGTFLKVNSGATGYEYGAVSSDFVKISSGGSATDVTDFTLDNLDVSTYSAFKLIWASVPTTDNAHLRAYMRIGGASGQNYANSDYRSAQLIVTGSSSSIATTHESNVSYWEFLGNGGYNSYEGHSLQVTFYPRKSTMEQGHGNSFAGSGTRTDNGSNFRHVTTTGHLRMTNSNDNQNYMTGIRIFYHSGQISQYDYELWGMK
jgi:hypothetical protein